MLQDQHGGTYTTPGEPPPHPRSEELLAQLLSTNQDLTDALRVYDELETMAQERALEIEAQERSKVDTRLDRTVSCLVLFTVGY
jgi:hypothetical protein